VTVFPDHSVAASLFVAVSQSVVVCPHAVVLGILVHAIHIVHVIGFVLVCVFDETR